MNIARLVGSRPAGTLREGARIPRAESSVERPRVRGGLVVVGPRCRGPTALSACGPRGRMTYREEAQSREGVSVGKEVTLLGSVAELPDSEQDLRDEGTSEPAPEAGSVPCGSMLGTTVANQPL